jgi:hypothetical protein
MRYHRTGCRLAPVLDLGTSVGLVATAIGQDFSDGKIVINSKVAQYLERKGVYAPRDELNGRGHS